MSAEITSLAVEHRIGNMGTERCIVTPNDAPRPIVSFGVMDELISDIEPDDFDTLQILYQGIYEQFRLKYEANEEFKARMTFSVYLQAMAGLMERSTSYCGMCQYGCAGALRIATSNSFPLAA
jgi:hypothetical protein